MVATTETCRGVAPASRIAANRCSRRAAARRVAVLMNTSTGNSRAIATMPSTAAIPWVLVTGSRPVKMLVTRAAPAARAIWAGVRPMMMTSEPGDWSAAGPIVPISWPGYRSASWPAGTERSSRASAGEA